MKVVLPKSVGCAPWAARAALGAAAAATVLLGCAQKSRGPSPPRKRQAATVHVVGASGPTALTLTMACSDVERARGLMHRQTLAPYDGMVFVFKDAAPRTFWMHNTPLSLDLLFFDSDHKLVCIVDHAEPGSDAPLSCGYPVSTVIEVLGGTAARLRLTEGARLQEDLPSLAALCQR